MVGGGTGSPPPELNTSAAPLNTTSQGLQSSGLGMDDIGDDLDYDGDGRNPNSLKRSGASGPPNTSSNPAISSRWGTAGQGLVSPDQVPAIMRNSEGADGEKMPTTRSAGSLQRDQMNDDQMKRPHTASAAGRGAPMKPQGQEVRIKPDSISYLIVG